MVELTVVTSVPAVGTVQSVALVVAPAAAARLWCERTGPMTALSAAFGMAGGVVGLAASLRFSVAAGAAIVLVVCGIAVVSVVAAPRRGLLARLGHDEGHDESRAGPTPAGEE